MILKHFAGRIFNPPRYLRLLEIIPTPDTDPAVTDFLYIMETFILARRRYWQRDTPAFIANRIGVFRDHVHFRRLKSWGHDRWG